MGLDDSEGEGDLELSLLSELNSVKFLGCGRIYTLTVVTSLSLRQLWDYLCKLSRLQTYFRPPPVVTSLSLRQLSDYLCKRSRLATYFYPPSA